MYFPYFVAYIAIGLVITLTLFFWALKNGQFQDQHRARFLPLRDEAGAAPVSMSPWVRLQMHGLFVLALAGLGASAGVLVYAIYFSA